MLYLLDTNIVSQMIYHPHGPVAQRALRSPASGQTVTSIIVAAELRFGAAKRPTATFGQRIEALFEEIKVLPFEAPADQSYGMIRATLETVGTPISANDLFIAAHALALDATLVTDNEREFARIAGLQVENWLH
jgi:tRNA(fMet)-specific endonuclease VapC